jgi:HSP20 family protein
MLIEHPPVSDAPDASHGGILPIDLYETPTAYVVRALLPGVTPENLAVSCHNHGVTLAALIPPTTLPIGAACIWRIRELGAGPFIRIIALDVTVDPTRIERRLVDGVLTLRLPKRK